MAATDDRPIDTAGDEEKEIDLREYFGILLEGWLWIVGFALIGLLIAAYLAWKQPPLYQATALMRVEQGRNMAPQAFMEQPLGGAGGNTAVSAEATVIGSRSVMGDAVDEQHLRVRTSPVYFPVIGEPVARFATSYLREPLAFMPFAEGYAWGNESVNVTQIQLPEDVEAARFQLVARDAETYTLLNGHGQAVLEGRVGTTAAGELPNGIPIKIFVEALNAKPGTYFNVSYVPRPMAIARLQSRLSIEEAPRGSGMLSLAFTGESPEAAQEQLDAIMASYIEQNVERQSEQAERRLKFLKKQLPEIRKQRDAAEERLRAYQTESGTLDLSAEARSIFQRLTNIDQQIAQTELQRQELLQEYTPQAPQVKAAEDKRSSLARQRNELQQDLKKLPNAESKLLELRREVEVNSKLYDQLLNTSQGLEITKAGITGVSHIVDSAYASTGKVAPKRKLWAILGLLLAAALAAILVLTRALLRVTLDDPNEIESNYGLPVYATVPFSSWENTARRRKSSEYKLLATHQPDDPSVESIRSFRTSLQFAMLEGETKFIGITGPTPGCGKSFISSNIAGLIAQTGARVLLIDGDMRRGKLYRNFNLEQSPGLAEVLAGELTLETAIQNSPAENLDFLATGNRPPNPAELLLSRHFEALKSQLERTYDYVIFDLPPVLNVTDASIVAKHVAATFLVVRSEHSTGHEVEQAIRRMRRDDLKITGAVFNGLKIHRRRYGSSKYGYYAYQY